MSRLAAAFLCVALAGLAQAHAQSAPALVPAPRQLTLRSGACTLGPEWVIVAAGAEDSSAVRALAGEVRERFGWSWANGGGARRARVVELRAVAANPAWPALRARQGYRLEIGRTRVRIAAATADGRFYGVMTLLQLLRDADGRRLPCLAIDDWPALEWRGVSDDVSRGQVSTLADFRAIVRELAGYKCNLYQPYVEDIGALDSHAAATPGALGRAELAAIVAEGRRWHVVVSPVYESLTHQEHALGRAGEASFAARPAAGPESFAAALWRWWSGARREAPTFAPAALATDDAAALRFAESRADLAAGVSGGPFYHMGGDEWQPAQAGDEDAAYGRFVGALAEHVRRTHGCRPMLYGDVLLARPAAARGVPRDAVIVDWDYVRCDSFPSLARLRALGLSGVIVSPGLWSWGTFHPDWNRAFANIAAFADAGKRAGALGCVVASWGDDGAENLRSNNWPGYAYTAAAAWEPHAPRPDELLRRFVRVHFGVDAPALARAEALAGWTPPAGAATGGRYYHRLPLVRERSPRFVAHAQALRDAMTAASAAFAAGAPRATRHAEELAALRLDVARWALVADRELLLDRLGRRLRIAPASAWPPAERAAAAAGLAALATRAAAVEHDYRTLWLRGNRPAGLAPNAARLATETARLERLAARAARGRLRIDEHADAAQALAAGD